MPETKLNVIVTLLDQFSGAAQGIKGKMKALAVSFRQNWLAVTAAVYAAQRAISALVTPAIEFEEAFAGVKKTVDATNAEFAQLSKNLKDMSREMPIMAKDLAKIQEFAGQLGIKGVKSLTNFTAVIAKLGTATDLSAQSASIGLARFANLAGDTVDNIENLGSALVGAGNEFKTFESNILELATRIAASGRLAGLTSAEILGIATAFSEAGINAEAGGTAIAKVLTELTASGRKGRAEFGAFIQQIGDAGDIGAKKLEELGFGSDRLKRAFLSVAVQGDRFDVILDRLTKDYRENIALQDEFNKRLGTSASQIQLIKNNIAFLTIEIGNKLLPAFEKVLVVVKELVDIATGEDLKFTKLETLLVALEEIDNKIKDLEFFPESALERMKLITDRAVLIGLIQEEVAEVRRQQLEEHNRLLEEANNLKLQGVEIDQTQVEGETQQFNFEGTEEELEKIISKAEELSAKLHTAFSSPLADLISGAKSAKEAFAELGKKLVRIIADYIAETVIAATIGKALQAVATKLAIIQAKILAEAWRPAAVFASIATAGGAAAAGATGITTTFGIAKALSSFHKGGVIGGNDGLARDEVPIIAQTGEGILSRQGLQNLGGASRLNELNSGSQQTGVGEIQINIYNPQFNSKEDIDKLSEVLGDELESQLQYPRA